MRKFLVLVMLPFLVLAAFSCESDKNAEEWPTPKITGVTTDYYDMVVSGKPVTIHGANFSPTPSDNKILYGVGMETKSIAVTEAYFDRLVFIAPKISATQLSIRVSTKGKESNSVTLEFDNSLAEEEDIDISAIFKDGTTKTVREGVEWTSFHGYWEGQIRNINIIKTTLNQHNTLGIYHQYDGDNMNLDQKCEYLDALVGTNGPMRCCHFVRVNGKVMRNARDTAPEEYFVSNCAFVLENNVPDIVKVKDNYDAEKLPYKNVGCAGPLLVYEGKIQKYPEDNEAAFLVTTHPRTAFGISKDQKTIYQVAVDGRWTTGTVDKRATGMETPLLARFMKSLGCYKALNFDGGGGTAMWIYGEGVNGIVNHPCDSPMNWDNPTLRATGNAIYIRSDLK